MTVRDCTLKRPWSVWGQVAWRSFNFLSHLDIGDDDDKKMFLFASLISDFVIRNNKPGHHCKTLMHTGWTFQEREWDVYKNSWYGVHHFVKKTLKGVYCIIKQVFLKIPFYITSSPRPQSVSLLQILKSKVLGREETWECNQLFLTYQKALWNKKKFCRNV